MHRFSKISVVLALFLLFVAATVHDLRAQSATKSSTDLELQYTLQKKDPAVSGVIGFAIPFLGPCHAGNCGPGVLPGAVSVAGWGLMLAQGSELGLLLYMGGSAWSAVVSYQIAQDSNRALRQKLGLPALSVAPILEPSTGKAGIQIQLSYKL